MGCRGVAQLAGIAVSSELFPHLICREGCKHEHQSSNIELVLSIRLQRAGAGGQAYAVFRCLRSRH